MPNNVQTVVDAASASNALAAAVQMYAQALSAAHARIMMLEQQYEAAMEELARSKVPAEGANVPPGSP